MTDRIKAYLVILENDVREDDAEIIKTAIQMVKGVLKVTHKTSDINSTISEERAKHEIRMKLYEALK